MKFSNFTSLQHKLNNSNFQNTSCLIYFLKTIFNFSVFLVSTTSNSHV